MSLSIQIHNFMTRWLMIDLVYLGHTTLAAVAAEQHIALCTVFFFSLSSQSIASTVQYLFFLLHVKIVFALLEMMKSDFRAQFKLINECNVWLFI